jgi:hypothetical protein
MAIKQVTPPAIEEAAPPRLLKKPAQTASKARVPGFLLSSGKPVNRLDKMMNGLLGLPLKTGAFQT